MEILPNIDLNSIKEIKDRIIVKAANNLLYLTGLFYLLVALISAKVSNPSWVKVFLLTSLISSGIAYLPSKKLVNWLYDRQRIFLLQLKAEEKGIRLWELTPRQ
ncbi:MAG: hypothetical protein BTN85_2117 [Candidatus Methanohalarchaeum thermophilum]|uniref:Uncharacterized protein n=1 Tax=Methanohalarchaeum thermophilum TaxID=1903181 RepID=A0A1Q6DSX3_METT1|nr:MAG: hypothetical protein BTN85_2117 [Candidatus Methanohalarchaeum thermophilum]